MQDCIFCKIVKKEIPCAKIYEDADFLSFIDIQPLSLGHTLIIPKKHIAWMQEADNEIITDIFKLTKKLMLAIKNALGCDYVQLSVIGKDIQHFHIHLIPRNLEDDLHQFSIKKYKENEKEMIIKKIVFSIP
ncbi:MAG: Histidine triad family protein [Candidatus Nomurabacteria bacterium GW2011_GWA1_37_20]|uniref:Histidine triad family protein n=2 Tax=Parcubacteria group TaxID=1794811 RepID=A0A0G0HTQ7_9BACT|nr:MAG: Histidine triad family protein [Parcubacteria group bacterium GW2011_GWC1_36_9]KKQ27606.1 MAG: Histidine triad family protein [Parcubacteria group bacterium GW2011_GWB1_37_13]KKQ32969.1 MAG: Histidine triad family protein [Candidatus Nomurabacteria bacterium GW2011_GWA1_37_20]KKQ46533.1 MAG: Histidine triad family protein [Candidatus Yanofskybacteria bacterium GW2011_GWC2_37_9]